MDTVNKEWNIKVVFITFYKFSVTDTMDESVKYWVWLQWCFGAENLNVKKILDIFGDARAVYMSDENELRMIDFLTEKEITRMCDKSWEYSENTINNCINKDIDIIPLYSDDYPSRLNDISAPPVVLYKRGTMPDTRCMHVAMVGTRYPDNDGKNTAYNFAYDLAAENAVVVSGGAIGIDRASHSGAVDGKGETICVIGSGIDQLSGETGEYIKTVIPQNGVILSEYPPGYPPTKYTFPKRNRIISGLSDCTIVVQAGLGSGAMHTVKYALEQNKKIFAVPSGMGARNGVGTNYLIRSGFSAALCCGDILSWYNNRKQYGVNNPVPTVEFYRTISEKPEKDPEKDNSRHYTIPLCYGFCKEISERSFPGFFDLDIKAPRENYIPENKSFGKDVSEKNTGYTDYQRQQDEKRLDELIGRAMRGEPEPPTKEFLRKKALTAQSDEYIRAEEINYLKKKLNLKGGVHVLSEEELLSLFETDDNKITDYEEDPELKLFAGDTYRRKFASFPFRLNPDYDEETESIIINDKKNKPAKKHSDSKKNVKRISENLIQKKYEKKKQVEKFPEVPEKEGQNLQKVKKNKKISPEQLTSDALSVYDTISEIPVHVDEIRERLGLDMHKILSALTELQLMGYITPLPGRRYIRK